MKVTEFGEEVLESVRWLHAGLQSLL